MTDAAARTPVTVYWRPGCPYCRRLRTDLHRAGLQVREVNIWQDPVAAARLRELARGNETVPTVIVGGRGMVNPSAARVLDAARQCAPGLVTARASRSVAISRVLRVVRWVVIAGLLVASFAVEARGDAAVSWVLDGVAVAV